MNEMPPGQEEPDDVGDLYRRASALEATRPSDLVRRRILNHAAKLAAERAAENESAQIGGRLAANRTWRRPAIFGTLAAAALAGLLITPRFFAPSPPPLAASSPARESRPESAVPAPAAPTAASPAEEAAGEQKRSRSRPESQSAAKPQAFARNAAPSADSAAGIAAKNAPANAQSMNSARSAAAPRDAGQTNAGRLQTNAGRQPAALAAHASLLSDPAAQLRRAAETGDIPDLQMLLDKKISVEGRDEVGRTALMLAALHGQAHAVDVLLAHGADPNAADAHGTTPLQAAIAADQQQIVAALQRAGAR